MFVQRYSAAAPANSPDDTLSSLLSSTLFKLSPLSAILLPRVYPVKGGRGARQNTGGYPAIACRRRSRVSPIPFLFTSFADPHNLSPLESYRSRNTGGAGTPAMLLPNSGIPLDSRSTLPADTRGSLHPGFSGAGMHLRSPARRVSNVPAPSEHTNSSSLTRRNKPGCAWGTTGRRGN